MQNFIVLGIIPGTNIQTNLNFWLVVACLLLLAVNMRHAVILAANIRQYYIARKIARTIDHLDLVRI